MYPPIDTLKTIHREWLCSKLQVWCGIFQQVLRFENLGLFPSTLSITEILNIKFQAPRAIFWLIRAPWKHQNQIWSSYTWLFKMAPTQNRKVYTKSVRNLFSLSSIPIDWHSFEHRVLYCLRDLWADSYYALSILEIYTNFQNGRHSTTEGRKQTPR